MSVPSPMKSNTYDMDLLSKDVLVGGQAQEQSQPTLITLLSIWPILERVAAALATGDLIKLARTSSNLRSVLHGGRHSYRLTLGRISHLTSPLMPPVGQHQTIFWQNLKSKTIFECSSKTHTRGNKTRACVYCSLPICDACIVRDSLGQKNPQTLHNRFRLLCHECWSEGKPVKSFKYRHVPETLQNQAQIANDPSHNAPSESLSDVIDEMCICTIRENAWICLECKHSQDSSPLAFSNYQTKASQRTEIQCYGYMCDNVISLADPTKDRRRVCLWCEKSLRQQLGSEDCYRRHARFYEICARNAADRTMRAQRSLVKQEEEIAKIQAGTYSLQQTGENLPRLSHLDAVNYRNFLPDRDCPSPESVWKSKNGTWTYSNSFLIRIGRSLHKGKGNAERIIGIDRLDEITQITQEGALPHARTNAVIFQEWSMFKLLKDDVSDHQIYASRALEVLKTRLLYLHSLGSKDRKSIETLQQLILTEYGYDIRLQLLMKQIMIWTQTTTIPQETQNQILSERTSETETDLHVGQEPSQPMYAMTKSSGAESLYHDATLVEDDHDHGHDADDTHQTKTPSYADIDTEDILSDFEESPPTCTYPATAAVRDAA